MAALLAAAWWERRKWLTCRPCQCQMQHRPISLIQSSTRIDLVAASADASLEIVEHAIFDEDFVNRRAPTRRVVLTEDVVKIAGHEAR
jgi:hypothetical protein